MAALTQQQYDDLQQWLADTRADPARPLPEFSMLSGAIGARKPPPPAILERFPLVVTDSTHGGISSDALYGPRDHADPLMGDTKDPWFTWGTGGSLPVGAPLASGFIKIGDTAFRLTLPQPTDTVVLRVIDGTIAQFAGRLSGTSPTLDGQPAIAATQCPRSSYRMQGPLSTLTLQREQPIVLRFPQPGTVLTLTVAPKVYAGGTIGAHALDLSTAADDGSRVTLENDSRVFLQSEILDEQPWMRRQLWDNDNLKQLSVVTDSAGRWMRAAFDPRVCGIFSASLPFWPEANEAAFEYDLLWEPDAEAAMIDGIKLPGWRSASKPDDAVILADCGNPFPLGSMGTLLAGNGGVPVHGNDGWSARGHSYAPYPAGHPLEHLHRNGSYLYWPGMTDFFGTPVHWDHYGVGMMRAAQVYRIYQRVRVNDVGQMNAELECRINGQMVALHRNFYLRGAGPYLLNSMGVQTELGIRAVWWCLFHGGNKPPARVGHVRFRNVKIARIA